jgi:hypothetical protein
LSCDVEGCGMKNIRGASPIINETGKRMGFRLLVVLTGLTMLCPLIGIAQPSGDTSSKAGQIPWAQRSWEDKVFKSTHDENYTFQNRGTYVLDPYVWAYTKEFAERFRMPERWVEPDLKGAYAVAWRMTTIGEITCGYGGKADSCWKPLNCQMDIYYDNSIDLRWNYPDVIRDNLMNGLSSGRFLGVTKTSSRRRYADPERPILASGGGRLVYGKYNQVGAQLVLFDRDFEPGVGLLSYVGDGVCPKYIGPEKVQMPFVSPEDWHDYARGKLPIKSVRLIHVIEFPPRFMKRANAIYKSQNKPNEDVINNVIRDYFNVRGSNTSARESMGSDSID